MIKDKTIDEALIEIMRTKKALEALRVERKAIDEHDATQGKRCWPAPSPAQAAAQRAMTSAHRPTTLQPTPAPWFAAKSGCDICGKCRSHGNHRA